MDEKIITDPKRLKEIWDKNGLDKICPGCGEENTRITAFGPDNKDPKFVFGFTDCKNKCRIKITAQAYNRFNMDLPKFPGI